MITPEPMPCNDFVELVTQYLDGSLDKRARERFEHHMALCPGCETYLEQIRQTASAVGRIEEHDLSEPARSHLLSAFRDWTSG
jgi:anti-sigma factor RsiW